MAEFAGPPRPKEKEAKKVEIVVPTSIGAALRDLQEFGDISGDLTSHQLREVHATLEGLKMFLAERKHITDVSFEKEFSALTSRIQEIQGQADQGAKATDEAVRAQQYADIKAVASTCIVDIHRASKLLSVPINMPKHGDEPEAETETTQNVHIGGAGPTVLPPQISTLAALPARMEQFASDDPAVHDKLIGQLSAVATAWANYENASGSSSLQDKWYKEFTSSFGDLLNYLDTLQDSSEVTAMVCGNESAGCNNLLSEVRNGDVDAMRELLSGNYPIAEGVINGLLTEGEYQNIGRAVDMTVTGDAEVTVYKTEHGRLYLELNLMGVRTKDMDVTVENGIITDESTGHQWYFDSDLKLAGELTFGEGPGRISIRGGAGPRLGTPPYYLYSPDGNLMYGFAAEGGLRGEIGSSEGTSLTLDLDVEMKYGIIGKDKIIELKEKADLVFMFIQARKELEEEGAQLGTGVGAFARVDAMQINETDDAFVIPLRGLRVSGGLAMDFTKTFEDQKKVPVTIFFKGGPLVQVPMGTSTLRLGAEGQIGVEGEIVGAQIGAYFLQPEAAAAEQLQEWEKGVDAKLIFNFSTGPMTKVPKKKEEGEE